jgi:hypothetical protein
MALNVSQPGNYDAKLKCVGCKRYVMKRDALRVLYKDAAHDGDLKEIAPLCGGCSTREEKIKSAQDAVIVKVEE